MGAAQKCIELRPACGSLSGCRHAADNAQPEGRQNPLRKLLHDYYM